MQFDRTVQHTNVVRHADGKMFSSPHGKLHDGTKIARVRALTPDDANETLRRFWDREIGQTVCQLESGEEIVLLNDECRG